MKKNRTRHLLMLCASMALIFGYKNIFGISSSVATDTREGGPPLADAPNAPLTASLNYNRHPQEGLKPTTNHTVGTNMANPSWRPSAAWIDQCVKQQKKDVIKPFHVAWRRYTFGDCFKMCRNCYYKDCVQKPWKTLKKGTGCYQKTPKNDTFAVQYHFAACETDKHIKGGNWDVLDEIMSKSAQKDNYPIPDADQVVIHLRLGDVIENAKSNVSTMLWQGADPWHSEAYKTSIKSVSEYLENLATLSFKKVSIRGGSHDPNYYIKSRVYAICLYKAIKEGAGYDATMILDGTTPDEDFYYIGHSKHLIVSSGGYSRVLGNMAGRNGGHVVGRVF